MRTREELQAEINVANAKIAHLDRMGEDSWTEGTMIYAGQNVNDFETNRYVFVKINEVEWVRTGSERNQSWENLVDLMWVIHPAQILITVAGSDMWSLYDGEKAWEEMNASTGDEPSADGAGDTAAGEARSPS